MENIADFISKVRNNRVKIAVVGDTMIDVYNYGEVSRISPEFPVPILHTKKNDPDVVPGGAGNVCYQFQHFNADASLFSFMDEEAQLHVNFNIDSCADIGRYRIPRKIRYYDGEFPMLRYDIEDTQNHQEYDEYREYVVKKFEERLPEMDAVILSNYNKGFFDGVIQGRMIRMCNKLGIPTIVDPKDTPNNWYGCTVFKPNTREAYQMTGLKDPYEQCCKLKSDARCDAVVITQQGNGVVCLADDYFEYRPKRLVREVSSVIGAGDCFAAVLSLCVAHSIPIKDSINYAFEASAQYVKAKHNRPITLYEVHRRLDPLHAKIIDINSVCYLRHGVYKNERWVLTNGCYDILHSGHLETFQQAKARGDRLVVAINSDTSVRRLKGDSRPIQPLQERQQVVAALECVDFVVSFDEDTPYNVINQIRPHVLVKGAHYAKEEVAGHDLVEEVALIDILPGNSTTNIITKIKNSG